ncbi:MAG: glycoside hydrolase family 3 C-terminal domain-containing protein [Clostridiales Family XIII bacterium]|jgi:beta-glucosidase|nr:glycoside hydrolase family 3 C-terminal domain-containing protein [Clostridiales Family XIII bacterium]
MRKVFKTMLAFGLVAVLIFTFAACQTAETKEFDELGSGSVKWSETETADGYMLVTNEDGKTLGYSKSSGVPLGQKSGYAFKDLNRNGELDAYEDWRLDYGERAADLAAQLPVEAMLGLMLHESAFGVESDGSDATTGFGSMDPSQSTRPFSECMDDYVRSVLNFSNTGDPATLAKWNNNAQAYSEAMDFGIPVSISANPTNLGGANYAGNLALAATMDTDLIQEVAEQQAKEYRAINISTLLGPQIDLAVDPRWSRDNGTFGEDPALSRDLTNAYISGLQSTYSEDGEDLGWGIDSVTAMMKHYPGDGPGEGGRESHTAPGKYNVYPGEAFETGLIPFVDGGLGLAGATGESASVMTSYSIAYTDDGSLGEFVGSAFSEYKINILRDRYDYDGLICSDWGVTEDMGGMIATSWGVEDIPKSERQYLGIKAGIDQFGGTSDPLLTEAYAMLVGDLGEEAALERIRESARRVTLTYFKAGLFENPYVSTGDTKTTLGTDYSMGLADESNLKSIVMLKNDGDAIAATDAKQTVYIPMKYSEGSPSQYGGMIPGVPAGWSLPVDEALLSEYFNVVTDTLGAPTGPAGEDGNPTYTVNDITRAGADQLAACDLALLFVSSPQNGAFTIASGSVDSDAAYKPLSLQYGEYTADSDSVRKESISGDMVETTEAGVYGAVTTEAKENRSYYGQSTVATNKSDLDMILSAADTMPETVKIVVAVDATNPMVFSEFESRVDAILMNFGAQQSAILEIVAGKYEPAGLLPMQMPKDMEAVEAQYEDVPRDMECYVDSAGNKYDFAFGLDWSGAISDDRTAKYNVPVLTEPANKGE